MKYPILLAFAICLAMAVPARAQTTIRSKFNGDRILFVDGDNIRPDPSGKRLLFIDHDFLRPDPQGRRLLLHRPTDGDIRPDLNGVRIACWDGTELRKTHDCLRLGLVDDKDFRPEPGYKTFFYMDGPPLTRMQLTAVHVRAQARVLPNLAGRKVRQKEKEMARNGAEEDARRGADQFPGEHPILSAYATTGATRKGTVADHEAGRVYTRSRSAPARTPLAWQGLGVVSDCGRRPRIAVGHRFGRERLLARRLRDRSAQRHGHLIPINGLADKSALRI